MTDPNPILQMEAHKRNTGADYAGSRGTTDANCLLERRTDQAPRNTGLKTKCLQGANKYECNR